MSDIRPPQRQQGDLSHANQAASGLVVQGRVWDEMADVRE